MATITVETDKTGGFEVPRLVFRDSKAVVMGYREFSSMSAAVAYAREMEAAGVGRVVFS